MELRDLVRAALAEDLTDGRDLTTEMFLDPSLSAQAEIEVREPAVVSGLDAAAVVFAEVDATLTVKPLTANGAHLSPSDPVLRVRGRAASILKAERTALNFLSHLSGIATQTANFIEATRAWETQILCTRKTVPALRELEVDAVRHGGGRVYRINLSEAILLKDNHLLAMGGLEGVRRRLEEVKTRDAGKLTKLLEEGKIEVGSLAELEEAVAMGWKQILLDNFTPEDVRQAVTGFGHRAFLELSGGVNLSNVVDYARTGVHAISIGALTHSSKAIDFSLEFQTRDS